MAKMEKMSKVIVYLSDNRVTISLAIYLSSYHYSASSAGAGEVTATPSENEREAQPLATPLTEVYVCFKALCSATSTRAI